MYQIETTNEPVQFANSAKEALEIAIQKVFLVWEEQAEKLSLLESGATISWNYYFLNVTITPID